MLSWEDMKRVAPIFFNMSIAVHNDPEASKEWGWVQARGAGLEWVLARWACWLCKQAHHLSCASGCAPPSSPAPDPLPAHRPPTPPSAGDARLTLSCRQSSHAAPPPSPTHPLQEMYAFTLSAFKAGIRGIDLHLKVGGWGWLGGGREWGVVRGARRTLQPPAQELEPARGPSRCGAAFAWPPPNPSACPPAACPPAHHLLVRS